MVGADLTHLLRIWYTLGGRWRLKKGVAYPVEPEIETVPVGIQLVMPEALEKQVVCRGEVHSVIVHSVEVQIPLRTESSEAKEFLVQRVLLKWQ
jgi:hypothetical protein